MDLADKIFAHPRWAGAVGIVGLLAFGFGIYAWARPRSAPVRVSRSPGTLQRVTQTPSPPKNVLDQIKQSSIWASPPTVYKSATSIISLPGPYALSVAVVQDGEVVTVTPSQLVDQAPNLVGEPIYLVGRVQHIQAVADTFGLGNEVALVPENGEMAIIGADTDYSESVGDVVYSLGRVAATGQARDAAGKIVPTAYFLALNPDSGVDFDDGDSWLDTPGGSLSRAMAQVSRETRG